MRGLMISAMGSGQGKTVLTCGLMTAIKRRGMAVAGFKCGPDYIDPMFHTQVLGVPSRNLDLFLQGEAGVYRSYAAAGAADLALVEGAMGFYDGVGGTDQASAYAVARLLRLPVVLAIRPKGSSLTLAAQVKGLVDFRRENQIAALVLTCCTPGLSDHLTPILERETGLPVLGYLPPIEEAELPSRHLGLYTAGEVAHLQERFAAVAEQLEKTVDLDRLLALAGGEAAGEQPVARSKPVCTIAIARDEAFCFYYPDNLEALEAEGAKLAFFSPLRDEVPPAADGLYLGGGYPEIYAQRLSENQAMRENIRALVVAGLPTVAECGGFLYLQKTLEDEQGTPWPMVGALEGAGFRTQRLQRFGYGELTAQGDSLLFRAGEKAPFHEFHYWDCTQNGTDFLAKKPTGQTSWRCGVAQETLYAAFPHLHFGGKLPMAERFVRKAKEWNKKHG